MMLNVFHKITASHASAPKDSVEMLTSDAPKSKVAVQIVSVPVPKLVLTANVLRLVDADSMLNAL